MAALALTRITLVALLGLAGGRAAAQWYAEAEEPRPASGERGPYAAVQAGLHEPMGPTLEGFDRGLGLAGAAGFRFGQRFGLELAVRRTASEQPRVLEVTQTAFVPSLRIFGSIGPVKTDGALGLGWFHTRAEALGGGAAAPSPQSKLGFLVNMNVAVPLAWGLDLLAGATYAGAHATVDTSQDLGDPSWIAGVTVEAGLRFTLPLEAED